MGYYCHGQNSPMMVLYIEVSFCMLVRSISNASDIVIGLLGRVAIPISPSITLCFPLLVSAMLFDTCFSSFERVCNVQQASLCCLSGKEHALPMKCYENSGTVFKNVSAVMDDSALEQRKTCFPLMKDVCMTRAVMVLLVLCSP